MYIIIMNNDGSLYGSHKERIMQREKLFNDLWFLIPPHYNGHDMSQCTLTLRYTLPISRDFKTETLVLSDEKYEEYLKYVLPIDTCLTKEWGEIDMYLTFTMLDVDDNGKIVQRVKKTGNHILKITQLPDWDSIVPDSALSALDQRILKQDAQIKALESLANVIENSQVNDLIFNEKEETLKLSANGVVIGKGVSVRDMLDDGIPVIDFDSNSGSNSDSEDNTDSNHGDGCSCGCDCDNNVVEFSYITYDEENPEDDDNVVEF